MRGILSPMIALGVCMLSACTSPQEMTDPFTFNQTALEQTDPHQRGHLAADSQEEQQAIKRFKDFFAVFSEENVRTKARAVYAQDVYFNDTLKSIQGIDALETYFLHSAQETESTTVEYLDVLSKEGEYYFRWKMHIRFKKLQKGVLQSSIGMSHIRFNPQGQVIFHQDYWDAASSFFEKIPLLGSGIRMIKRRL